MNRDTNLLTCFSLGWQGNNATSQVLPPVTAVLLIQSSAMTAKAMPAEQLRRSWTQNLTGGLPKTRSGPGAQKYKAEETGNGVSSNPFS